jgi:Protein of unknown function (DUF2934)
MVTAKKTSTTATDATRKPKAKAAAKKTVATPVAAPEAPVKKSPAKKSVSTKTSVTPAATRPAVTTEQRHHYIELAAFYVAQRRGFAPGNPVDDWAMAELEVDRLIASGHFNK